ncbi:hypothetical protein BS78_09G077300 [Paspalum vaginatum]|nr:hypothetical protein BS78_09G077300 [Paspalum vaginatum]
MGQDAPNALVASDAVHPSPPSRLLSKHRPRRRAAAPRPPLPPPALPPPAPAPARGLPDLTLCHCCGVRFPAPQSVTKPKRCPVRQLSSLWRIVLLCAECLSLVSSAAVCSYCLSLDNLPPEDSAVACRRCKRCVHRSCIPAEHRTALIQPVDVQDFICVDCCPTVRLKSGSFNLGPNLDAYSRDPTSAAGGNTLRKAVEVKPASKRPKDAIGSGGGFEGTGSGDPVLLDEELALQVHLAMNGSQRISRSGSSSGGGSARQVKGKNDVGGRRIGKGNQEICVMNTMAQLDDDDNDEDEGGEEEPGCNRVLNRFRRFDSSVTVVLALECVKGKLAEESMKAKRKVPRVAIQKDDLVDGHKKYSKRSSSKQAKAEHIVSRTVCDRKDMDGDHDDTGVAPMK